MGWLHYYRPSTRRRMLAGEKVYWVENNGRAGYIRQCVLSFPIWCDIAKLREMHAEKVRLTAVTGQLHELDHIIPLNHPEVCGLSVPENVEIRLKRHNQSKGNRWVSDWHPPQLQLFDLTHDQTCDAIGPL